MNTELETLKQLNLPGCVMHQDGLELLETASIDDIRQCAKTLGAIENCRMWLIGDLLAQSDKYSDSASIAEMMEISDGTARNAKMISMRFPRKCHVNMTIHRNRYLSWSHHLEITMALPFPEAMKLDGMTIYDAKEIDLWNKKAKLWQTQAETNKWSTKTLRGELRLSKATVFEDPSDPGPTVFPEIENPIQQASIPEEKVEGTFTENDRAIKEEVDPVDLIQSSIKPEVKKPTSIVFDDVTPPKKEVQNTRNLIAVDDGEFISISREDALRAISALENRLFQISKDPCRNTYGFKDIFDEAQASDQKTIDNLKQELKFRNRQI